MIVATIDPIANGEQLLSIRQKLNLAIDEAEKVEGIETTANSALQPGDNVSQLINDSAYLTTVVKADITDFSDADYATAAQGTLAETALQDANIGVSVISQTAAKDWQEVVYTLVGTDLDPTNGSGQILTLTANTSLTESLVVGQTVSLLVKDGDLFTLSYPSGTDWGDLGAPTLKSQDLLIFTKLEEGAIIAVQAWSKT
jgi:hypothetical protein